LRFANNRRKGENKPKYNLIEANKETLKGLQIEQEFVKLPI